MSKPKNILFLFPDQHRGDWLPYPPAVFEQMGSPPLPLRMENLRSLMERGTTFTRAVTDSPLCAPARACLASGLRYDRCGVWNNNFCYPLAQPTCYSVLRDGGYQVAGVGKFDLHKPVMYWGKDGWIPPLEALGFTEAMDTEGKWDSFWASYKPPRGPYGQFLSDRGLLESHWRDYVRRYYDSADAEPTELPQDAYADDWVTDNALSALDGLTKREQPWFLMVNFSGPHDPWDITGDMKARWENVNFPIPRDYRGDPAELVRVRQNYAAMLENIDRNIGKLLSALKAVGQYDDTVIVYASDHGEMLGDRNRYYKSVPYAPSVHIPLVMSGGGIRRNAICGELVQLSDLAATIAEFAGLSMPEGVDSRSLVPLASREDAPPVHAFLTSALYSSVPRPGGRYAGYEAYEDYEKNMGGKEFIDLFNQRLSLPQRPVPPVKTKKIADWHCVITKKYKLIAYPDSDAAELYDLEADPLEQHDVAASSPEIVRQLRQYGETAFPHKNTAE